eukprot:EC797420.1.p1 GENE.EC797420.1~~EC797420.1.p1  ORF type:complete len:167 (+),score=64.70 EC797420.1:29-529(+)
MALQPYLDTIRKTLDAALCLTNFASQEVERHNKPEVEAQTTPEVVLKPVEVCRSEMEKCLIEPSINSVRISITIKQIDELDRLLVKRYTRLLQQRAAFFVVLRKKPVPDYDLSFLITNKHLEGMPKDKLIDFIIAFMDEVDKTVSDMKLSVNTRASAVAKEYLSAF